MAASRVERHRDETVDRVMHRFGIKQGSPPATMADETDLRAALLEAYYAGASWGEQDGYQDAKEELLGSDGW